MKTQKTLFKTEKLFIPGPVNVEKSLQEEMMRGLIGHRDVRFKELYKSVIFKLKDILTTEKDIFIIASSATGAMEATIRNTINKNVLCLANGAFGRKWYEIAVQNNKKAKLLDFGDGVVFDLDMVKKELGRKKYEAVTFVINDTASGIENNAEPLKKILKKHPQTMLLADGVTALFGTEIDLNGIDVLVCSTQKALALPPGIAFAIVSYEALKKAETVKNRGYYFDFLNIKNKADKNLTLTTPNIPLMFAIDEQLSRLKKISLKYWIKRHENNAILTRNFFLNKGIELFVDRANCSKTVTVVKNNKNIDVEFMILRMREKGYLIPNGYGGLKNKTFRVGHMGVTEKETIEMLKELDYYID